MTKPVRVNLVKPASNRSGFDYIGALTPNVEGPRGLPLVKPPYGRITAIDLNKGEHVWMVPLGDEYRNHPALKDLKLPPLGSARRAAPLLTKTLLFIGQQGPVSEVLGAIRSEGREKNTEGAAVSRPKFSAFEKTTGKQLWEIALPANVTGAPMTYLAGGKQYIVFAVGGLLQPAELIALSLVP